MAGLPDALLDVLQLGPREVPPDPDPWRSAPPALLDLLAAEGATAWCWRRLRSAGLAAAVPPAIAQGLHAAAQREQARNLLVDEAAEAAIAALDAIGLPLVLLKGTARRAALDRYPYGDARATHDVDLLLPSDAAARAFEHLRRAGYTFATDPSLTPDGHHHRPPLVGPHRVAVELHDSTGRAVPPQEAWRRATSGGESLTWRGLAVWIPGPTELLWHATAHAVHDGTAGFRLRHLLGAATVCARDRAPDWETIAARLSGPEAGDGRLARAWLGAAARLGGSAPPDEVGAGVPPFDTARALAWRLRVMHHAGRSRWATALDEEGTRALLDLPRRSAVAGTASAIRLRRRLAAAAARAAFRIWSAASVQR